MATEQKQKRTDLNNFLRILAGVLLVGWPGYTAILALTSGNIGAAFLFALVAGVVALAWWKWIWR